MGRRDYQYFQQSDFRGGVNIEPENAGPNQVLDARNVWAPDGKLVQRPGYFGVGPAGDGGSGVSDEELSDGTTTGTSVDLNGVSVYYVGSSTPAKFNQIALQTPNTNTTLRPRVEYYNSSGEWANIKVVEFGVADGSDSERWFGVPYHLEYAPTGGDDYAVITFAEPADWATTDVDSVTGYWVRLTMVNGSGASAALVTGSNTTLYSLAGKSTISSAVLTTELQGIATKHLVYVFEGRQGNGDEYIETYRFNDGVANKPLPYTLDVAFDPSAAAPQPLTAHADDRPTAVIIPLTEDVFLAHNYLVYEPVVFDTDTDLSTYEGMPVATVSDLATDIGVLATTSGGVEIKAQYHPDYVATDGAFPEANYLAYFEGQLFAANQKEAPSVIKWSAPFPSYKVWPSTNFAALDDNENSPITGLTTFSENLIVFKNDSIWQMVNVGQSDIGQNIYVPRKIVSGIGCVANSSIQQTPLGLIFLAEDGLYLFDGSPQARKLSGNLDDWFANRISTTGFKKAASAHWRTNNCYFLAVPTDGSGTNNIVFVYDYKHNAMWIWDNLPVASFLVREGAQDLQEIYFFDYNSQMFQFGGNLDNGATLTSYFETQRQGYLDFTTKSLREVRVWGNNALLTGTVAVSGNDAAPQNTTTLTFSDTLEAKYGSATFGTSTFVPKRRRQKRATTRVDGEWFTVKVTNTTRGRPLEVTNLTMGYVPKGRR